MMHSRKNIKLPYFSIDNAHLMYNAHPKLMSYISTLVLLLHLIYFSYLSNVYRACSFFTNLDLFCIDNAHVIYRKIRHTKVWFQQRSQQILKPEHHLQWRKKSIKNIVQCSKTEERKSSVMVCGPWSWLTFGNTICGISFCRRFFWHFLIFSCCQ